MKSISLYVHIPFCKRKCFYCDFHSFYGKENLMERYTDALVKEIKTKAAQYEIKTVFIGGGTPTYLHLEQFEKLLIAIKGLNLSEEMEYTVECNPGTLDLEKLRLMKAYGVNRLSLGLQACQDNLLKGIGRIHSYDEFVNNFKQAREVGFTNMNVDLMFGLPNQSLEEWRESLETIAYLKPEHISAYSLIIEEGTPFYKLADEDKLPLPSEDDERTMYLSTKDILRDKGYHQYEISNYSLEGRECKHNLVYWNLEEYLACGTGASSYVDGVRYKNIEDLTKYMEAVESNEETFEEIIENTIEDNMEEFMFMGLRKLEGISAYEFQKLFEKPIEEVYGAVISKHINNKLLEEKSGRIRLTSKGIELSNVVMSDFLLSK